MRVRGKLSFVERFCPRVGIDRHKPYLIYKILCDQIAGNRLVAEMWWIKRATKESDVHESILERITRMSKLKLLIRLDLEG